MLRTGFGSVNNDNLCVFSRLSNLLQQINLNPDALSTPEKLEAFQEHVAAVVNKWVSPGWITHPSTPSGAPVRTLSPPCEQA